MLELADEGPGLDDLPGWTTATNKAREALARIIANINAKTGLPTDKQAVARKFKPRIMVRQEVFRLLDRNACAVAPSNARAPADRPRRDRSRLARRS